MYVLSVVADVLVVEEEPDNFLSESDFIRIRGRLFEPLLQEPRTDLSFALIQEPVEGTSLPAHARLRTLLGREYVQGFEGRDVQSEKLAEGVAFQSELLLCAVTFLQQVHVRDARV